MQKTIYTRRYRAFVGLLRQVRVDRGLTQIDLAKRLRTTQSEISKCESAERRLDVIELRSWCEALDITLPAFISRLEHELSKRSTRKS